ncbi:MAG TPA: HIT domain-containing protein [Candidatus Saccharimonadales bacterium]|nr:HIT domain-containing protein [Candidatus Saccharimonadales bacterium]
MKDCLFCQIAGDKSKLVWENAIAAAFPDINPKAPVHVLLVPKKHIESLDHLEDPTLGGQLLEAVAACARSLGIGGGYRVQINVGRTGGQIIDHLHIHIMGGQRFRD